MWAGNLLLQGNSGKVKAMGKKPQIYVIAGPNGAGKTTFARKFLPQYANCRNFVNADLIAGGLSPFSPRSAAIKAGKLLLREIHAFAEKKMDFAFETTLSGKTYVSFLQKQRKNGYSIHLFFLWIPNIELAIARIKDRVSGGGHDVAEVDIRRRFHRSIQNFLKVYRLLVDSWYLFDNSTETPRLIAKEKEGCLKIIDRQLYAKISGGKGDSGREMSALQKDLMQIKAEEAIKEAVREVIEDHRRSGRPLVIWRKNRVVRIPADKLFNKSI